MDCAFCGRPVEEGREDEVYREVKSWVTGPKLDHPVMREQTGRVAHASCIRKLKEGQAPDQEELL